MIEKDIIPWYSRDYQNEIIATFDCETFEDKIQGPQADKGLTYKAHLKLLSIAVGSNLEIEPRCWIRKSSDPDGEILIGQVHAIFNHSIFKETILEKHRKPFRSQKVCTTFGSIILQKTRGTSEMDRRRTY